MFSSYKPDQENVKEPLDGLRDGEERRRGSGDSSPVERKDRTSEAAVSLGTLGELWATSAFV